MTSLNADSNRPANLFIPNSLSNLPNEVRETLLMLSSIIKKQDKHINDLNTSLTVSNEKNFKLKNQNKDLKKNNHELCSKYINLMKIKSVKFPAHEILSSNQQNDLESDGALGSELNVISEELPLKRDEESEISDLESDSALPQLVKPKIPVNNIIKQEQTIKQQSVKKNFVDSMDTIKLGTEDKSISIEAITNENKKLREVIKNILARKKMTLNDYLKENYFENTISSYKETISDLENKLFEFKKLFDEQTTLSQREIINNDLHIKFYDKLIQSKLEEDKAKEAKKIKIKDEPAIPQAYLDEPKIEIKEETAVPQAQYMEKNDSILDSGFFTGSINDENKIKNTESIKCLRCKNDIPAGKYPTHQKKCRDD